MAFKKACKPTCVNKRRVKLGIGVFTVSFSMHLGVGPASVLEGLALARAQPSPQPPLPLLHPPPPRKPPKTSPLAFLKMKQPLLQVSRGNGPPHRPYYAPDTQALGGDNRSMPPESVF